MTLWFCDSPSAGAGTEGDFSLRARWWPRHGFKGIALRMALPAWEPRLGKPERGFRGECAGCESPDLDPVVAQGRKPEQCIGCHACSVHPGRKDTGNEWGEVLPEFRKLHLDLGLFPPTHAIVFSCCHCLVYGFFLQEAEVFYLSRRGHFLSCAWETLGTVRNSQPHLQRQDRKGHHPLVLTELDDFWALSLLVSCSPTKFPSCSRPTESTRSPRSSRTATTISATAPTRPTCPPTSTRNKVTAPRDGVQRGGRGTVPEIAEIRAVTVLVPNRWEKSRALVNQGIA